MRRNTGFPEEGMCDTRFPEDGMCAARRNARIQEKKSVPIKMEKPLCSSMRWTAKAVKTRTLWEERNAANTEC